MVVIKLLDVLTEIKGAEDTADKIEADAQLNAKKLIKSTEEKADVEIQNAVKKAKTIEEDIIKRKEDEGRREAEIILKSAEEECKKIKEIQDDKIEKAVSLVIERIVNGYGNS
jgi:V/A-type H+-transporting ATPase subunit G/H